MSQCDGCARKLPIIDGLHFDGRKPFIACTRIEYEVGKVRKRKNKSSYD